MSAYLLIFVERHPPEHRCARLWAHGLALESDVLDLDPGILDDEARLRSAGVPTFESAEAALAGAGQYGREHRAHWRPVAVPVGPGVPALPW